MIDSGLDLGPSLPNQANSYLKVFPMAILIDWVSKFYFTLSVNAHDVATVLEVEGMV